MSVDDLTSMSEIAEFKVHDQLTRRLLR